MGCGTLLGRDVNSVGFDKGGHVRCGKSRQLPQPTKSKITKKRKAAEAEQSPEQPPEIQRLQAQTDFEAGILDVSFKSWESKNVLGVAVDFATGKRMSKW